MSNDAVAGRSGGERPAFGRLALTVGYDGTDFAGSQTQPNARTVQRELETALGDLFGAPTAAVFAGRTDRGVHAVGQVVGCEDRRPRWSDAKLLAAVNAGLPSDVAVSNVSRRPSVFHARYDARWREYRYRVWSGPPQPLARRYVWRRSAALDAAAMDEAAGRLVGEHDFASFAGGGRGVPWAEQDDGRGTVRRVMAARCRTIAPWWGPADDSGGLLVEAAVVADGFLPQMVRTIVGALVEVGRGTRRPEWMAELLALRDRRAGVATAPPQGLTLWRVGYGDERPVA